MMMVYLSDFEYVPFLSCNQARAYGSFDGKLTLMMVDECVKDMLQQHQQKQRWEKGNPNSTVMS